MSNLELVEQLTGQKLSLISLSISIVVNEFLSETSLTMVWENETDKDIKAELVCPLDSSATISGYAIDIEGVLVDGVLIEKEVARAIQETEIRQNKSVSITENVVGNAFRTEVSQIKAKQTRKIKLSFFQTLVLKDNNYNFIFPLIKKEPIKDCSFQVVVLNSVTVPQLPVHPLSKGIVFTKDSSWPSHKASLFKSKVNKSLKPLLGNSYSGSFQTTNMKLLTPFILIIPNINQTFITTDLQQSSETDGELFFAIKLQSPNYSQKKFFVKNEKKKIGILWDWY